MNQIFTATPEVSVPLSWTIASYTMAGLVLAIVVFGLIWTMTHSRDATSQERVIWLILQIVLPVVGFIAWLVINHQSRKRLPS